MDKICFAGSPALVFIAAIRVTYRSILDMPQPNRLGNWQRVTFRIAALVLFLQHWCIVAAAALRKRLPAISLVTTTYAWRPIAPTFLTLPAPTVPSLLPTPSAVEQAP